MLSRRSAGVALLMAPSAIRAALADPPRAARSVHLSYPAPDGDAFSTEMIVEQSVRGSYFMACGWNTGYFGVQELADRRKVVIFSVWDPTKGDDPGAVKLEDRVELLHQDPAMRIRRFGGEGTGGQCMGDLEWSIGKPLRFLVHAHVEAPKTSYTGFVDAGAGWRKLVTFRTRTGGLPLKGYYSFLEDFRRDTRSAGETRRASFGAGRVRTLQGDWVLLHRARFTASNAEWEAKDTIDAAVSGDRFRLSTGGDIRASVPLRTMLELNPLPGALPPLP